MSSSSARASFSAASRFLRSAFAMKGNANRPPSSSPEAFSSVFSPSWSIRSVFVFARASRWRSATASVSAPLPRPLLSSSSSSEASEASVSEPLSFASSEPSPSKPSPPMPILRLSSCPILSCSAMASFVPGRCARPLRMARFAQRLVFLCFRSIRSCARKYSRRASAESADSKPASASSEVSSRFFPSPSIIRTAPVLRLCRANVLLLIALTRFALSSCRKSKLRIFARRARRSPASSAESALSRNSSARSTSRPLSKPLSLIFAMIARSKSLAPSPPGSNPAFIDASVLILGAFSRSASVNFNVGRSRFAFTVSCHSETASPVATYAALRSTRSETVRGNGAAAGTKALDARRSSRRRAPANGLDRRTDAFGFSARFSARFSASSAPPPRLAATSDATDSAPLPIAPEASPPPVPADGAVPNSDSGIASVSPRRRRRPRVAASRATRAARTSPTTSSSRASVLSRSEPSSSEPSSSDPSSSEPSSSSMSSSSTSSSMSSSSTSSSSATASSSSSLSSIKSSSPSFGSISSGSSFPSDSSSEKSTSTSSSSSKSSSEKSTSPPFFPFFFPDANESQFTSPYRRLSSSVNASSSSISSSSKSLGRSSNSVLPSPNASSSALVRPA